MKESYFNFEGAYYFMRHSELKQGRKTLLFIHGIGDSSLNYLNFLHDKRLRDFNILIPDLLGNGKSSHVNTYSYQSQVAGIIQHLKFFQKESQINFDNIVLISHSIGGINASFLCESSLKESIQGWINVEGSVTQYGSFITEETVKVAEQNQFPSWFQSFKDEKIFRDLISKFPLCKLYYASLQFCDPKAFLQISQETQQICKTLSGTYTNLVGKKYAELNLPKIYCYGDKSLHPKTIEFLNENQLETKIFHTANHFIMVECYDEFVEFILSWISHN